MPNVRYVPDEVPMRTARGSGFVGVRCDGIRRSPVPAHRRDVGVPDTSGRLSVVSRHPYVSLSSAIPCPQRIDASQDPFVGCGRSSVFPAGTSSDPEVERANTVDRAKVTDRRVSASTNRGRRPNCPFGTLEELLQTYARNAIRVLVGRAPFLSGSSSVRPALTGRRMKCSPRLRP
jgi:hypothetical protein